MNSKIEDKHDYQCTQFDFTNASLYQKKRVNNQNFDADNEEFPPDFENLEEYISQGEEDSIEEETEVGHDTRCK